MALPFRLSNLSLPSDPSLGSNQCFILKKTILSSCSVKLLLDGEKGLIGKIISPQAVTTVYRECIKGIPNWLVEDLSKLRPYLKHSYLVVHACKDSQHPSFVIHVHLSLLGGGSKLSVAKNAFNDADRQADENFYTEAIPAYKQAIRNIKRAIDAGYTGQDKSDLSTMLRDAYFRLAEMQEAVDDVAEALNNYQQARNLGKMKESEEKMQAIHLKLAKQAMQQSHTVDQMDHLLKAKAFGSQEADLAIAQIERAEQEKASIIRKAENPDSLAKHTTKTVWQTGFRLGKGVTLSGKATSIMMHDIQTSTDDIAGVDRSFEYLIWNEEDLKRVTQVESGLSTTQSFWHIKMIADYANKLTVNKQKLHCIIANTYVAPQAYMFQQGRLTDQSLFTLKRSGYKHFTDMYGSHLIGGYSLGAVFLGCISFSVNSREDAMALCASLRGSLTGLLNADASVQKNVTELSQQRSMEVSVETIGLKTVITGRVIDLEALRQKHEEFRKALAEKNNLTQVEAICEPWSSLEEVKQCLNAERQEALSPAGMIARYKQKVLSDTAFLSLSKLYTPLRCVTSTAHLFREKESTDLFEQFDAFLNGNKKVLVLLGQAGSGKSSFLKYIERKFWDTIRPEEALNGEIWVPIRVEIIKLKDPVTQIVTEQLSHQGLTKDQIQEIKTKAKVILLLDGYDEGNYSKATNLFETNGLAEWKGKVLISGRLNARKELNPDLADHLSLFAPIENDRIRKDLAEELIICPFFASQITTYVDKFISNSDPWLKAEYPSWFENNGQRFHSALSQIPGLLDLIRIPFILQAVIESLPKIIQNERVAKGMIFKHDIYKIFIESCFEREEIKMYKRNAGFQRPIELKDEPLNQLATKFCRQIATKMYTERLNSVSYSPHDSDSFEEDEKSVTSDWDMYFGNAEEAIFLRNICSDILIKTPVFEENQYIEQYTFAHTELTNYFLALSSPEADLSGRERKGGL